MRIRAACTPLVVSLFAALGCVDATAESPEDATSDDANMSHATPETMAFVRDLGLGWNLGNTLDAVSSNPDEVVNETFWGNPPASEELFLSLKADGIDSIRIPVSWRHLLNDNYTSPPDDNYIAPS